MSHYDFKLPNELIAQVPMAHRVDARLMVVDRASGTIAHHHVRDLPQFLNPEDCLVLNNTKVLPARLIGRRTQTGGKWEGLFLAADEHGLWKILSKTRGKLKPGEQVALQTSEGKIGISLELLARQDDNTWLVKPLSDPVTALHSVPGCHSSDPVTALHSVPGCHSSNPVTALHSVPGCHSSNPVTALYSVPGCHSSDPAITTQNGGHGVISLPDDTLAILNRVGWVPIPPYIRNGRMIPSDREQYQTVYASKPGAVAAPTAGLHFSPELLTQIQNLGIDLVPVTLHVGAGTFKPIVTETIEQHVMHYEWCEITDKAVARILRRRRQGGRVIAVGTTSVRVLESASLPLAHVAGSEQNATDSEQGELRPFSGETNLFIKPGYTFRTVDAMLTNFHLPLSTLLILVRTFGGDELIRCAYNEAIAEGYRFYSYGDAMIIF